MSIASPPPRGHNGGPPIGSGPSWQRYCWTRARAELLPTLPLEVVRLRVNRARALGIDYRTYAGIRAATGRDLVAFLFSTETLRLRPVTAEIPPDRLARLTSTAAAPILLTASDLDPERALRRLAEQGAPLAGASPAPPPLGRWAEARAAVLTALQPLKLPSDAVLMIGEGTLQRGWAEAGSLAGFLAGDRWFAPDAGAPRA